jgi:hypothetical protein
MYPIGTICLGNQWLADGVRERFQDSAQEVRILRAKGEELRLMGVEAAQSSLGDFQFRCLLQRAPKK